MKSSHRKPSRETITLTKSSQRSSIRFSHYMKSSQNNMEIKSHKDLEIWKQSMDLVVQVYKITKGFPVNEQYGITSQVRRSAVSVPSNIAEGAGRRNTKEFIQFLYIALGSLAELDTQLDICERVEYIKNYKDFEAKIISVRIMISKLIKVLKEK